MADQLLIGNFSKGEVDNREAFNIDNDAFPKLFNAYSWRGRVLKKRGTSTLDRLRRQIQSVLNAEPPLAWQYGQINLVADAVNLITFFSFQTSAPEASIVPGSINLTDGVDTWTDPDMDGTLEKNGVADPGSTINYATGDAVFTGAGVGPLTGTYSYYPALPVMGLRNFVDNNQNQKFPLLLAFDTRYSYQVNQSGQPRFVSTSYYKGTNNPVVWSGENYQQFWTTNFQSALWATNNKAGFHFKNLANTLAGTKSIIRISATRVSIGITAHGLIVGDYLWINEVGDTIAPEINTLTGIVTTVTDANTVVVDFTGNNNTSLGNFTVGFTGTGGIAQYLTSQISGQDGIRWYDGDPTAKTGLPTGNGLGWVNFAPPLFQGSNNVSINDQVPGRYYLVGALAIINFKDRLLFFGPMIQTSTGSVIQRGIQDTVIYSWNGTPYYSQLVPTGTGVHETGDATAYLVDVSGKGGWQSAGLAKPALTFIPTDDVILTGFGGTGQRARLNYTGNDVQPFLFYATNSEYPANATFSAQPYEQGGVDIGPYGITYSDQQGTVRIDDQIPNEVFKVQTLNNGNPRINSIRDYYREWVYFTYPLGTGSEAGKSWVFPAQTFLWNYKEKSWAIFRENYTTTGLFRKRSNYTWRTLPFKTWTAWRQSWSSGTINALFASVVVGNPQGFVLIRDEGTQEAPAGDIQAIDDTNGFTRITSVNHCLNSGDTGSGGEGDYVYFSEAIGSTYLNDQIGLVVLVLDKDQFVVDIPFESGTYLGLGKFSKLTQPLIQTKQFPIYWDQGRKVRICAQKYLMSRTAASQVTVNINLSQDPATVWNRDPQLPDTNTTNTGLIYSQLLYTCPESINLGLTPANVNLQMPTASTQNQIWHRLNTSMIGDSVQLGITLSHAQMKNLTFATSEIGLHAIQLTFEKGPFLS